MEWSVPFGDIQWYTGPIDTSWAKKRSKRSMKHLWIASVIGLASVLSVKTAENKKHLFILSGQSNMARLDPDIAFTPTVEAIFGKGNVVVVKDAQGGQPIRRWYKKWKSANGDAAKASGDLYDRLMEKVRAAINGKKIASITFVWMQGERDAGLLHGESYADSLRGLIDQLRADMDRKDVNFVIGRLCDFNMGYRKYLHWKMVRKAQVEVAEADPRGAWVDTDDLSKRRNRSGAQVIGPHFSAEGYKELGKRFAEKSIELIEKHSQQTAEPYEA